MRGRVSVSESVSDRRRECQYIVPATATSGAGTGTGTGGRHRADTELVYGMQRRTGERATQAGRHYQSEQAARLWGQHQRQQRGVPSFSFCSSGAPFEHLSRHTCTHVQTSEKRRAIDTVSESEEVRVSEREELMRAGITSHSA